VTIKPTQQLNDLRNNFRASLQSLPSVPSTALVGAQFYATPEGRSPSPAVRPHSAPPPPVPRLSRGPGGASARAAAHEQGAATGGVRLIFFICLIGSDFW